MAHCPTEARCVRRSATSGAERIVRSCGKARFTVGPVPALAITMINSILKKLSDTDISAPNVSSPRTAGAIAGLAAAALGLGAYAWRRMTRDERSVRAQNQPRNEDGTFKPTA